MAHEFLQWEGPLKKLSIALVLLLCAGSGYSQCVSQRISARKEMRKSTVVFVGTVVKAKPVAESWDFLDGVNYTVRVDSVIHGKAQRHVYTIFSENSTRLFPMTVGDHYVLYVQPLYDRYQVDNCGNSHQTEEMLAGVKQPKQFAKGY